MRPVSASIALTAAEAAASVALLFTLTATTDDQVEEIAQSEFNRVLDNLRRANVSDDLESEASDSFWRRFYKLSEGEGEIWRNPN